MGPKYFEKHYKQQIINAVAAEPGCCFVLGDADGVDQLAQQCLSELNVTPPWRVKIFIKKGKTARVVNSTWPVDDSSENYPARDLLMAKQADSAIVCVPQYGGLTGGTLLPILEILSKNSTLTAVELAQELRLCSEAYDPSTEKMMSVIYEQLSSEPNERNLSTVVDAVTSRFNTTASTASMV